MNHADQKLMREYGITAEKKTIYCFAGYAYDHLTDAVHYAKASRPETGAPRDGSPARDEL